MFSHHHQIQNEILHTAVSCLLGEVRYQCSVITDFNLPSNFITQQPKLPVKRKKRKANSRTQRTLDKERKRKERSLLKHVEEASSNVDDPSASRFQTLYKQNDRYRESKKSIQ